MSNKMTERTILLAMLDGTIDPEVMAKYAEKKLDQLDKHNAASRRRAAKKRAEGDALMEDVFNTLCNEPMSREDVYETLIDSGVYNESEITVGKVSYRLVQLAKEGRIIKQEAITTGEDGKKIRKVAVYTLA